MLYQIAFSIFLPSLTCERIVPIVQNVNLYGDIAMHAPQNVIAVIFDFDDTLTDESTSKLLEAHGIDTNDFWRTKVDNLIKLGWDPSLAYLKLMLDNVGEGKPLGKLSNSALSKFGAGLEFYQGIPTLFDDLRALVSDHTISRPSVEFYIVSSGLEEVIRGSSIASHFEGIWGCRFHEQDGYIDSIMNAVSFTEKTRFLYAINKGLRDLRVKPYGVNEFVEEEKRRIPFRNMIYIGDGFTDVPCFSLLSKFNGTAFGVFDPRKKESPKKAWEKLVAPKRVSTMNSPRYGGDDDLGALLRAAVKNICVRMDVGSQTALS